MSKPAQHSTNQHHPAHRLPVTKLPFVGERADGRFGYWVLSEYGDDQDPRIMGRTFAAWYLLYAEYNGPMAAEDLMDRIEREMPSRYPAIDRAFLAEVMSRRSKNSSAA